MRVIVFGAAGGTGQEVVTQALAAGHTVTAFVRAGETINTTHEQLIVFSGDVLDQASVTTAVREQDAVISVIGLPAKAKLPLRTLGTENIIKAMKANNVTRFISQSALGVGDSMTILTPLYTYLLVPFVLKKAFLDHLGQENAIKGSRLDWTIGRMGALNNGPHTGHYKQGFSYTDHSVKLKISRADAADFLVRQLSTMENNLKIVGVSY